MVSAISVSHIPAVAEMTSDDLELERYLLDLALQPLDRFDGFVQIEQYLLSALRYQLNYTSYALAMAQYTRTPAFTGYLAEAQANLIEKMRDKRVWGYWAHECLIGYQRWNPDPIAFANVMYTGFFGVMLGLYETLHPDRRFSRPGALTLRWSEDTAYPYDFRSLCEAIVHNMDISKHDPLYACEPRFIYPMCNTFSLNTLLMHDRLHGTDFTADRIDRMLQALRRHKYLRKDGRFISGAGPLKLQIGPAVGNDAVMAYWCT
jgi:Linalool dehydratase/isomerase